MDKTANRAKDPGPLAARVIPALFVFLAAAIFQGLVAGRRLVPGAAPTVNDPADALAGFLFLTAYVGCGVITLRWFHRTNANAHLMARDLTVTPGWSVGWFFVPLVSLWMPFKAFSETWRASVHGNDWKTARTPDIVRLWWGLWVAAGVCANLASYPMAMDPKSELAAMADLFQVLAMAIEIPLVIVLALIVKQLTAIQAAALRGYDFD